MLSPVARRHRLLVLENAWVLDPQLGINERAHVALDGRVVAGFVDSWPADSHVVDASSLLMVPGIIDLHTHVFPGYPISLNPRHLESHHAAPVVVDAGTAGWRTFRAHRSSLTEHRPLILVFLNLASYGLLTNIAGIGELSRKDYLEVPDTVECVRENRDMCLGIKVRLGKDALGDFSFLSVLEQALMAANLARCPLMVHIADLEGDLKSVLSMLRPGDIVTHIFHGGQSGLKGGDPALLGEVIAAQRRGIIFDVGYGTRHFDENTALAAVKQGFWPDTVSSDSHTSIDGLKVPSLYSILSLFLGWGMDLTSIIARVTSAPRGVLLPLATEEVLPRLQRTGSLAPGSISNAVLLDLNAARDAMQPRLAFKAVVVDGTLLPNKGNPSR